LESEFEDPESEFDELATNDALGSDAELETPVTTNLPEAAIEESELESELLAEMPDVLDPQMEPEENLDSQAATIAPSQELLLEQPGGSAQGESVYRGEFWSPPLTPELQSELAPHTIPSAEATDPLPLADAHEIRPIPPLPFSEFAWRHSQPAQLGSTESEIGEAVVPVEQSMAPLSSPQEMSGGYQPFAAGNPAIGVAVELNPLQSLPLPGTIHDSYQVRDFQLNVFSESSVDQPVEMYLPVQSELQEPHELVASPVDTNQTGAYESLYPAPELGQGTLGYSSQVQAVPRKTPQANPDPQAAAGSYCQPNLMPQATAKCPLFSRFCCASSRHKACKLRLFTLCPALGGTSCQDQACQNPTCSPQVTRGLLKNWFNGAPAQHQCGICKWLCATPGREPVHFATNGLLERNVRPLHRLGRWLLEPPRHRPLLGLGKWLAQPPRYKPLRGLGNFLFQRSAPPTRGLLSRFHPNANSSS